MSSTAIAVEPVGWHRRITAATWQPMQPIVFSTEPEKAIFKLRHGSDSRPEWMAIPVAGIGRPFEGC